MAVGNEANEDRETTTMWLFTTLGFFSAVCARQGDGKKGNPVDTNMMMVRARNPEHLQNLVEAYPEALEGCERHQSSKGDYCARIFVPKNVWSEIVRRLTLEQCSDNFKSSVGAEVMAGNMDYEYEARLHEVWDVMYAYQTRDLRYPAFQRESRSVSS